MSFSVRSAFLALAVWAASAASATTLWSDNFESYVIPAGDDRVEINGQGGWLTNRPGALVMSDYGSQILQWRSDVNQVDGPLYVSNFFGPTFTPTLGSVIEFSMDAWLNPDSGQSLAFGFYSGTAWTPILTMGSNLVTFGSHTFTGNTEQFSLSLKFTYNAPGLHHVTLSLNSLYSGAWNATLTGQTNFAFSGVGFRQINGSDDGWDTFDNLKLSVIEGVAVVGDPVPEPFTMGLVGAALAAAWRKRRRSS